MIKERIKTLAAATRETLKRFPVTMLCVAVTTILLSFFSNIDTINGDWLNRLSFFLLFWGVGTFFAETVCKKTRTRILTIAGCALWSAFWTWFCMIANKPFGFSENLAEHYGLYFLGCYSVVLLCMTIFSCCRQSHLSFPTYVARVFLNYLRRSIVYAVLFIGTSLIVAILIALFLHEHYDLLWRVNGLVFGLFLVPGLLYGLVDVHQEASAFEKGLIRFALLPMVGVAFIIIYAYMLKILILWQIPSNEIFRILMGLFLIGCPIWTMAEHYASEGFEKKLVQAFTWLFIPFIGLQIFSIYSRIRQYGVVPLRYLCVLLVIAETAYILLTLTKKVKREAIFLLLSLLAVVACVCPWINMQRVSIASQNKRLSRYLVEYESGKQFTDEEAGAFVGAYDYLEELPEGMATVLTTWPEEKQQTCKIAVDTKKTDTFRGNTYASFTPFQNTSARVPTDGYAYAQLVYNNVYSMTNTKLAAYVLQDGNDDMVKVVDFTSYIKEYYAYMSDRDGDNGDAWIDSRRTMQLDDNTELYIVSMHINARKEHDTYTTTQLDVTGILLTKN